MLKMAPSIPKHCRGAVWFTRHARRARRPHLGIFCHDRDRRLISHARNHFTTDHRTDDDEFRSPLSGALVRHASVNYPSRVTGYHASRRTATCSNPVEDHVPRARSSQRLSNTASWCYHHIRYGANTHICREPCTFSEKNLCSR